jgi:hypothetical protein
LLKSLVLEWLPIVVNKIFRLIAKRCGITDLLNKPLSGGVSGDSEMFNLAAVMADNQQNIQHLEC